MFQIAQKPSLIKQKKALMPLVDYKHLIQEIKDYAIYIIDTKGIILTWNLGAQKIKGYASNEAIGKNIDMFYPREYLDTNLPKELLKKAYLKGRVEQTGFRIRKDGTRFLANVIINAINDENKDVIGYTIITRDLTAFNELEELLLHSEENFRVLVESSPDPFFIINDRNIVKLSNTQAENVFGYSKRELINSSFENLLKPIDIVKFKRLEESILKYPHSKEMYGQEISGRTKKGTSFPIEITFSEISSNEEEKLIAVSIRDISFSKNIEIKYHEMNKKLQDHSIQLEKLLLEKNIMLKEIHHRVKNNLQTISSLLRMQANSITDKTAAAYLKICEQRIRSIALIHMQIYNSQDLSRINFKNYILELSTYLFDAFKIEPERIKVELKFEDIYFSIEHAIPFGIMINELMSNSLKYAFPNNKDGKITVAIFQDKINNLNLIYKDNGIGICNNNITEISGLGNELISSLTFQMEGTMERKLEGGLEYIFNFHNSDKILLNQNTGYEILP